MIHEVIYFKGESDGIEVEAAFQYTNEFHENVMGFCNNIYNAEGATATAFLIKYNCSFWFEFAPFGAGDGT